MAQSGSGVAPGGVTPGTKVPQQSSSAGARPAVAVGGAARRNQINLALSEDLLNRIAAAVHRADVVGRGPKDQTDLVVTALEAYLRKLERDINERQPFDRELGARLRERRRRR